MNTYQNKKVSFEDVPYMMADLLDQMRILSDRVKFIESNTERKTKPITGRELLTTMEVTMMLKVARITVYRMARTCCSIRMKLPNGLNPTRPTAIWFPFRQ